MRPLVVALALVALALVAAPTAAADLVGPDPGAGCRPGCLASGPDELGPEPTSCRPYCLENGDE